MKIPVMDADVIVLGAGIVGVCTALHLQARGRRVCLIDRGEPGAGTSHGNAGLIERSSVVPYAFPRELTRVLRYALNREADVRYELRELPRMAGWLLNYWRNSAPRPLAAAARAMLPLVERSVVEHDHLLAQTSLGHLVQANGWIDLFRDPQALQAAEQEAIGLERHGLRYEVLTGTALRAREPALRASVIGGIHWLDPKTVSNPGALTAGYAQLLRRRGGQLLRGDAASLREVAGGWSVQTGDGEVGAREVVLALGPDSPGVYERLGYRIPMAIKRGYHMHYNPLPGCALQHAVCDTRGGFVLSQMQQGVRLTTGIEIAPADAPARDIQLRRAEALARQIYPLGERLEATPWLGRRPCLADMRPVIGPAPRHPGLWFNFGHAHHGLTLGPVSGRLLAEMMTGEPTLTDPTPYSALRF